MKPIGVLDISLGTTYNIVERFFKWKSRRCNVYTFYTGSNCEKCNTIYTLWQESIISANVGTIEKLETSYFKMSNASTVPEVFFVNKTAMISFQKTLSSQTVVCESTFQVNAFHLLPACFYISNCSCKVPFLVEN